VLFVLVSATLGLAVVTLRTRFVTLRRA
jgi:hypothetical protein